MVEKFTVKDFNKITIRGGCFGSSTELVLFQDSKILNIIYGRNGTGKTSIARAIRRLVRKNTESTESYNEDDPEITSPAVDDDVKSSVYIFDEDFVEYNVKMTDKDGLSTIVMLGEQVNLDNEIDKIEEELKTINDDFKVVNNDIEQHTNKEKAVRKNIEDYLRNGEDDYCWANFGDEILGNKIKTKVSDTTITEIAKVEVDSCTESNLKEKYKKQCNLYLSTSDVQTITWKAKALGLPENLNDVEKLLKYEVIKPEWSEREQALFDFLQDHINSHSVVSTNQLLEEKWSFCPLCLREINETDHNNIRGTLTMLLTEEAESYIRNLDEKIKEFQVIEYKDEDEPKFPEKYGNKERKDLSDEVYKLNEVLSKIIATIESRKSAIYETKKDGVSPFEDNLKNKYVECVRSYKEAIQVMENCVNEFNIAVDKNRKEYINDLEKLNNLIARKHLDREIQEWQIAKKGIKDCSKKLEDLEKDIDDLERKKSDLENKKQSTNIALNDINKQLQIVFYDDKKLQLVGEQDCYKIKIQGRNVSPKKISTGERNILGLCYFFTTLSSGKNEKDKYKNESLIVIDDPISSFDEGNRVGVMTLLNHHFSEIYKGNNESKILFMTHDLRAVFDLLTIRKKLFDLPTICKKLNKESYSELLPAENGYKLEPVVIREKSEYKKLLTYVYNYANDKDETSKDDVLHSSIGNIIRRVAEAFSTFCYNVSFDQMIQGKNDILDRCAEYKELYRSFVFRLVLNGESHMEERVYALDTRTQYFSYKEKVRTARFLLILLYCINKNHIKCYLGNDKIKNIEKWKEDEESQWRQ